MGEIVKNAGDCHDDERDKNAWGVLMVRKVLANGIKPKDEWMDDGESASDLGCT